VGLGVVGAILPKYTVSKLYCICFGETRFLRQSLNMILLLLHEHTRNGFGLLPSLVQNSLETTICTLGQSEQGLEAGFPASQSSSCKELHSVHFPKNACFDLERDILTLPAFDNTLQGALFHSSGG